MDSQSDVSQSFQDYFNIVIIGDENTGKTSILERYCYNKFSFSKKKQRSLETYKKSVELNGTLYKLKLWDTKYDDNYSKLNNQIYERADCIIFVCSVDNKESFTNLQKWFQLLSDNMEINSKLLFIVANKSDLEDEREVTFEEIKEKSKELEMDFFEVSAMENNGIEECFDCVINKVIKNTYNLKTTKALKPEESNHSSQACKG